MGMDPDEDDDEDNAVAAEAAAHLSAAKSAGNTVSLADEAAQFNSPVEHALAVLKIIGVSEHEDFGNKLGAKLVEDNVRSVRSECA